MTSSILKSCFRSIGVCLILTFCAGLSVTTALESDRSHQDRSDGTKLESKTGSARFHETTLQVRGLEREHPDRVKTPGPSFRESRIGIAPTYDLQKPDSDPPLPPSEFNPDPTPLDGQTEPLLLFENDPMLPPDFGSEPLNRSLELPRYHVQPLDPVQKDFEYRSYSLDNEALPPNTEAVPNRWFLGFGHWKRYLDPSTETTYQFETPRTFHPYQQSVLKGDVPVIGQDIFTSITVKNFTLFEHRRLPTPSGVSAAQPNASEFFGRSEQSLLSNDLSLSVDLFKGETAFKPIDWDIRILGVYNVNEIWVRENNVVDPDPRGAGFKDQPQQNIRKLGGGGAAENDVTPVITNTNANKLEPGQLAEFIQPDLRFAGKGGKADLAGTHYTRRLKDFFALQEAFVEIHLADISAHYDFVSTRFGIQPFVSDFRGFIFADTNLGLRFFGNADNNRWQYNMVFLDMREKDTYSELNSFEPRDQYIFIANIYRQDFFQKGYTAQFSFHANFDEGETHFDKNTFQVRPALLGTPQEHSVQAYYLGWTGDGHLGRFNITHAFYEVLGEDQFNGLAGHRTFINAQMAAAEVSYDRDWFRCKLSGFYASGDRDPIDGTATGFDSIQDNPFFIGGPFSWYVHQGFNLAGTTVNLKQRDSLVPDLRSSKTEGQANFVNPGVLIAGVGTDIDVTPKLRAFSNINYIWLDELKPIELALQTNKGSNKLGLDCSFGIRYRPLLTQNIVFSVGLGLFFPDQGYKDIYRRNTNPVPGFGPQSGAGKVDSILWNVFATLTFTY